MLGLATTDCCIWTEPEKLGLVDVCPSYACSAVATRQPGLPGRTGAESSCDCCIQHQPAEIEFATK